MSASASTIDREREPDHHPRRVVLELEVGELAQPGEVEDLVEPRRASRRPRPIITPFMTTFSRERQLGVEADAELDERREPAGHADPAASAR